MQVANSIDFVVEKLDTIKREVLAARLTLNTLPGYVAPQHINAQEIKVCAVNIYYTLAPYLSRRRTRFDF